MKHVLISFSDEKYGDFLADHWLASLKDNVHLANIEVVILDYGLTAKQKSRLTQTTIIPCRKDGHVNIIRFRDIAALLDKHRYDQVMMTDGGDIIFQTDIAPLFEEHKNSFRAVVEDIGVPFERFYFKELKDPASVKKALQDKQMVNCGVLLGPASAFKKMAKECFTMMKDTSSFGPDQVAVNYILYREGFVQLPQKYNFIVTTMNAHFTIQNGTFYLHNRLIPIVHNAGRVSFWRPIRNFGYGPDRNKIKPIVYYTARTLYKIINFIVRR